MPLDPDRIRFIYFDLDDTLLDHRAAERNALADCHARYPALGAHPVAHVQEVYHAGNVPLWKAYAAGDLGRDDVQRLRFERLLTGLNVSDIDAPALGEHYLRCYARHWRWMEGAESAFHALADRFPVGLLTNGFADVQHAKLARFPELRERASATVISEEVGVMKPSRQIFEHAAELAGVPPDTLLYVGDSLHSDVQGGLGAGWQVAWFSGQPHAEAFSFDAWPALLDALA